MNVITVVILVFSLLGAVDWLIGNKIGVGKEFEKAFSLFCPMALSMLGMIVIAPAVGAWLAPVFEGVYNLFGIDPSVIPASLLANDMGGMSIAQSICVSDVIGSYNAFVVSSMMGCAISFTLPFSLGLVKKAQYNELFLGILCGIGTVPIGYGDGVPRRFREAVGRVCVRCKSGVFFAPVAGNICMDQMMLDLTGTPAEVGDQTEPLGDIPTTAAALDTIPYEILTSIKQRVPRIKKRPPQDSGR